MPCCRNQFQILEPLCVRAGDVQDIIDFPVAAPKGTAYRSASLKDLAQRRRGQKEVPESGIGFGNMARLTQKKMRRDMENIF